MRWWGPRVKCFGWSRHKMDFHLKKIIKKGQFPSFLHDLNSTSVQRKFPWEVPWFYRDKRWSGDTSYPEPAEQASFWQVAGSSALPGVATGQNVMFCFKNCHRLSDSRPGIWNHTQLARLLPLLLGAWLLRCWPSLPSPGVLVPFPGQPLRDQTALVECGLFYTVWQGQWRT